LLPSSVLAASNFAKLPHAIASVLLKSPIRIRHGVEGIHELGKPERHWLSVQTIRWTFTRHGSDELESQVQVPVFCASRMFIQIILGIMCICFADFHFLLPSRMADQKEEKVFHFLLPSRMADEKEENVFHFYDNRNLFERFLSPIPEERPTIASIRSLPHGNRS
jgi:hypothetical protein